MKTNREKLISLRDKHELTRQQIADKCGVSIHAVHSWFNPPTSNNHSPMPDNMLRLLRYELGVNDES